MPEEMLPAAQRESRKKNTSPASRGAEAIPAQRERRSRRAYRPRSGKMRADLPLRRAADKVNDMRQRRPPPHGTRGSTGVVGGVEGLAPLTPCRQPRRLPHPDAGLKPQASGKKKIKIAFMPQRQRKELSAGQKGTSMPKEMLPAAQRESRKKSHQPSEPGRGGDPRAAGAPQQARISPAKREDARRLPHAVSGGQGIRHATVTPSATRDKGVYGGRRGCRGARPSHPLPPAAQATPP